MWVIASIPFWLLGFLSFSVGVYGIAKVSLNKSGDNTFAYSSDENVIWVGFGLIFVSGLFLLLAAKIAS